VNLPLVYAPDLYWIPYAPGIAAAGPFVDLNLHPDRLDVLPEVAEMPALRPILELLNQPSASYLTIGCGTRRYPPGERGSDAEVECYAEFAHRDREMREPEWLYDLFHAFATRTAHVPWPAGLGVEFVMRPLGWRESRSVGCWALGYQVRGLAADLEGANALVVTGLERFHDFLRRFLRAS
jgi:hypothetical protein